MNVASGKSCKIWQGLFHTKSTTFIKLEFNQLQLSSHFLSSIFLKSMLVICDPFWSIPFSEDVCFALELGSSFSLAGSTFL